MPVHDRTSTNKYLKEYRECRVNTCVNRIFNGGVMCSTHRYRFNTHGSYDLPGHTGEPSTLDVEVPPEWSFGKCKKHGWLRENEMYRSQSKDGEYKSRRCVLDRNIKKHYSVDGLEGYERLVTEKGNKCEICKEEKIALSPDRTQKRQLSIDHCHKTGKVRGILCKQCNSALGFFKDNVEFLQAAIDYLRRHQDT